MASHQGMTIRKNAEIDRKCAVSAQIAPPVRLMEILGLYFVPEKNPRELLC